MQRVSVLLTSIATLPELKRDAGDRIPCSGLTPCVSSCTLAFIHNMTTATVQTFDILGHEFSMDELNDIATHGCVAGVPGFIYSSELADVFDANEHDIWTYLDEHAFDLGEKSGMQMVVDIVTRHHDFYTMQDIKEKAVWMFVELFAVQLLQRNGHPDWA
jgi:hypothetical protein